MKRVMRKMSAAGDELVKEWSETATPAELEEIEKEFNRLTKAGYFAANVDTAEIIQKFDEKANILMLPRMQGGAE